MNSTYYKTTYIIMSRSFKDNQKIWSFGHPVRSLTPIATYTVILLCLSLSWVIASFNSLRLLLHATTTIGQHYVCTEYFRHCNPLLSHRSHKNSALKFCLHDVFRSLPMSFSFLWFLELFTITICLLIFCTFCSTNNKRAFLFLHFLLLVRIHSYVVW
jgi:hypothetical protein